jgi:hypothetical protein
MESRLPIRNTENRVTPRLGRSNSDLAALEVREPRR